MQKSIRIVAVVATTTVLAACSGAQLDNSRGMTPQGGAFNAALYDGYMARSQHEYDYGDYRSSDMFAERAVRAANGETVQPFSFEGEPIASTAGAGMVDSKSPQIVKARRELVDVLQKGGRTKAPQATADAQLAFDCWLEETQPAHFKDCRDRFKTALQTAQASVAPKAEAKPAAEPEPMEPERATVYFGFDDSTMQNGESGKIADAASAFQDMPDGAQISITGHADRVGAADYNRTLSMQRARNVKAALVDRGVPASAISVAARGESEPAVKTGDGAREAANRRVEIIVG